MIMNTMTKENFWNEIEQRWPGEFIEFKEWIDEYKKQVQWESLFPILPREHHYTAIKFHHLPDAMQLGVFIQYTKETPHRFDFIIEEGDTFEKIIENIKEWFYEEHSWAESEHQEGKYLEDDSIFTD